MYDSREWNFGLLYKKFPKKQVSKTSHHKIRLFIVNLEPNLPSFFTKIQQNWVRIWPKARSSGKKSYSSWPLCPLYGASRPKDNVFCAFWNRKPWEYLVGSNLRALMDAELLADEKSILKRASQRREVVFYSVMTIRLWRCTRLRFLLRGRGQLLGGFGCSSRGCSSVWSLGSFGWSW